MDVPVFSPQQGYPVFASLAQSNRIKTQEQLSGTFSKSQGAVLRRHP
jgi:hypothetical protein